MEGTKVWIDGDVIQMGGVAVFAVPSEFNFSEVLSKIHLLPKFNDRPLVESETVLEEMLAAFLVDFTACEQEGEGLEGLGEFSVSSSNIHAFWIGEHHSIDIVP